jgi:hypothetical protein
MVSGLDRISVAVAAQVGVQCCAIALMGRPVDGSDTIAADLEDWQFVLDEGPAIVCYRTHHFVEHPNVDSIVEHCPLLAEHLITAGIRSIATLPVLQESQCLGTITLYSKTPCPLRRHQRQRATRWAHRVARSVGSDVETWATRRHHVTADFDVATGCVIASSDVDATTAATMIRAHAYADQQFVRALCYIDVQPTIPVRPSRAGTNG